MTNLDAEQLMPQLVLLYHKWSNN